MWSEFNRFYTIRAVFFFFVCVIGTPQLELFNLSWGAECLCLFLWKLLQFPLLRSERAASFCRNVAVTGGAMGRVTDGREAGGHVFYSGQRCVHWT